MRKIFRLDNPNHGQYSCLVAEMLHQGFRPVWWWTTYLVLTVIASPICFAAYGSDKRRAARQLERSELRVQGQEPLELGRQGGRQGFVGPRGDGGYGNPEDD